MKKILLVFVLFFATALTGNATTIVHYNNAGVAQSVRVGTGPSISANRYYAHRQAMQTRYARPSSHRAYGYYPSSHPNHKPNVNNQISRFDKNYKVPTNKQKMVCGGITYYNMTTPCRY